MEEKKEKQKNVCVCADWYKSTCFWKIVSLVLLILLLAAIYTKGFTFENGDLDMVPENGLEEHDLSIVPDKNNIVSLIENDAIKGSEEATITIVEWSDFECPFCERFYSGTFQQIKEEYIDTGKVNFVFRDFPLSFHKYAQKSSEAAECAGEQGKYYEMHDLLFEKGVKGGESSYKQFAIDIGLNSEQFDACLDSGRTAEEVKKDMADGQAVGVRGTPAFYINGEFISGAQPFEKFKEIIDAELEE
ncbi:DsbA family protein [Candidatus Woesearchaeota archaeon]|nr:DsbA family protein [Candidatus Woesearchaeota archaeon]